MIILPDMFSDSSIFNAGKYQTLGYTASVTQKLGDNLNVTRDLWIGRCAGAYLGSSSRPITWQICAP